MKNHAEAAPNAPSITIVVDTREQLPYTFSAPGVSTLRGTLQTGDYSLLGYETRVAIERKTLNDFVGSITRERQRFMREVERMKTFQSKAIVVEANWSDVVSQLYRSKAHPASVFGSTIALIVDHEIPVYFLSSRHIARRFTERFLTRFHAAQTARDAAPCPLPAAQLLADRMERRAAPNGEPPW